MSDPPVLLLLTLALSGCVERDREPPPSDEDLRAIARNILLRPPRLDRKVEAELEGRVLYLGLEVDKDRVRPGEIVKLTHYWRSLRAVDPGWEIFVNLSDGAGRTEVLEHRAIGGRYPAARWRAGQVIRDAHTFTLPADWKAASATVQVGLRKGAARLKVSRGPGTGADRVIAAALEVEQPRPSLPRSRVMQIVATRAPRPPTIDGKLEDPVWARCTPSDPLRRATGDAPRTVVRVAWDPDRLYLGFESEDAEISSPPAGCEAGTGSGDLVGLLLQVDAEERLELVVGPGGTGCLRRVRSGSSPPWRAASELKAGIAIDGTLDRGEDRDRVWTAELALPWRVLGGRAASAGETIRVNFFRIEAPGARAPIAWSPSAALLPDGELQLGDERGSSPAK